MRKLFNFHKNHDNEEMHPAPPHELNHGPEPHDPHRPHGPEPRIPHGPHDHHEKHTPPHPRKNIPLNEQEIEEFDMALSLSFQEKERIKSASRVFWEVAPPEVQTVIFQIIKLYSKLAVYFPGEHKEEQTEIMADYPCENETCFLKFFILDPPAKALFYETYGDKASSFIEALEGKPNEIVEAAILLARLYKQVNSKEEG